VKQQRKFQKKGTGQVKSRIEKKQAKVQVPRNKVLAWLAVISIAIIVVYALLLTTKSPTGTTINILLKTPGLRN
jgi:hypothetical protein